MTDRAYQATTKTHPGRLSALTEPIYLAHRGGSLVVPEHSLEGYRAIVAAGARALEPDVFLARDGSLLVMHDTTIDRTTTGTGNVVDQTALSWQNLTMDAGSFLGGTWGNLKPTTFEQVLREFGGKVLLVPEAKNTGSGAAMTALIQRYGVQDSILMQAFDSNELTAARAAGIATMVLSDSLTTDDRTSVYGLGTRYIGVSSTAGTSYVTDLISRGFKVFVYTVNRQYLRDQWLAQGVSGFWSDDPIYLSGTGYRLTADPFSTQTWYHGMSGSPTETSRGVFVSPNRYGFVTDTGLFTDFALAGWIGPITATTYAITATVTYDAVPGDTTRWATIFFAGLNDKPETNFGSSGTYSYQVLMRASGLLALYKVVDGVASLLTSQATAAIVTGGTAILRIDVTPTAVTVTRTDVSAPNSVTSADTAYRGGYVNLGKNGNGLHVSFSAMSVA